MLRGGTMTVTVDRDGGTLWLELGAADRESVLTLVLGSLGGDDLLFDAVDPAGARNRVEFRGRADDYDLFVDR